MMFGSATPSPSQSKLPLSTTTFWLPTRMFAPVVTRFRSYAVPLDGAAAAYAEAIWNHPPMKEWEAAARVEPLRIEKYESD